MEPGWHHFKWHMVPCNSTELLFFWSNITEFYGILWNFEIVTLIDTRFLSTSIVYCMEFHGTFESQHQISPSSMEFHGTGGTPFQMTPGSHGIPWKSMELLASSKKLHEIPCNCKILMFHNLGCAFCSLLHDFIWSYISQSISGWNIDKSTFWCPLFRLNCGMPFKIAAWFIQNCSVRTPC